MKQLGDITRIHGGEIAPVDVVTFGSPCQDLSVAGKRAGLDGERSGLFLEAIRIIQEMREATHGRYPTFAVWENVTGAYSSNKGEDFRQVLEETLRVGGNTDSVPRPSGGKWLHAGSIVGDGVSLCWRTLDAQYWGVPQRRARIFLVADFGGIGSSKILFKQTRVRWNPAPCRETRESTPGAASESAGVAGGVWKNRKIGVNHNLCGYIPDVANTLTSRHDGSACADRGPTIVSVYDARGNGTGETVPTMTGDHGNRGTDYTALLVSGVDCRNITETENIFPILQAKSQGGYSLNYTHAVRIFQSVRRLTPLECERLQGYPDGWTDLPGASDSARYKALGNSVAIPCVVHVLSVIADELHQRGKTEITLGSLFDGIGGFPLAGSYCGMEAVWASEIEAFPIAVTDYHFGED